MYVGIICNTDTPYILHTLPPVNNHFQVVLPRCCYSCHECLRDGSIPQRGTYVAWLVLAGFCVCVRGSHTLHKRWRCGSPCARSVRFTNGPNSSATPRVLLVRHADVLSMLRYTSEWRVDSSLVWCRVRVPRTMTCALGVVRGRNCSRIGAAL